MSEKYRTVHVPEDPIPPHNCRPKKYSGPIKPEFKDGTIRECLDCGIFWYASVFRFGAGTVHNPYDYNINWSKVRWYNFRMRRYVR